MVLKCFFVTDSSLTLTQLEIASVQVLLLDHIGPTSLRFGLGTFFGPDSVHVQRSREIHNAVCTLCNRQTRCTGLLRRLVTAVKQ